ncbi:MAG: V-type ATP synthase subunit E family protein [Thermoproteota archaeon]|jgi:V/A-type H+-transporting ATPase subunit E|nr:V-type ATP synthase subunit E family protein [Thermoproteota archaeon]
MSSSSLERTIDKVLAQNESELTAQVDSALKEALNNLDASRVKLQSEYDGIIESAKKQAENIKRQIIGSSRLTARNRELLLIESAINDIFAKAKQKLGSTYNAKEYRDLLKAMIEESVERLGSAEVVIECNKNDFELVKKILSDLPPNKNKVKLTLSKKPVDIIGGIRAVSGDGTMTLDNSLDSRIERLKPLIRKEIVQLLRGD